MLVSEKKLRNKISKQVEEKMKYLSTCYNERDIILRIIKNSKETIEFHCNTDCPDKDCVLNKEYKDNFN